MGDLGDVVPLEQAVHDLAAQIEDDHQDQGDGDLASPHGRERGQHDHHKYHAAGAQQHRAREEQEMHQSRDHRRHRDGPRHGTAAVLLLQPGAHQQQQQHIAHVVFIVRVTQHMAEKTHIGQRVGQ